MEKSIISRIVSIILIILLIGGIVCLFFLPYLYDLTGASKTLFTNQKLYYKILFYLCYIISLIIIFILSRIFNVVYKTNPFNKLMMNYIKYLSVLFMTLALLVGIKICINPTVLSIAVVVLTFIVSLCFYVVGEVFKVAINYKEEVDYTV